MSRSQAIAAKCKDCIYDPKCGGGTWRQQVEACTIKTCALWPYRPKAAKPIGERKTGPRLGILGGDV